MPYIVLDPALAQPAPALGFGQPETAGGVPTGPCSPSNSVAHPAGKSLDQMRVRLRVELGNRSVTDLPDVVLTEWINDAYIDLYGSLDLPESKISFPMTTIVDQAMYLLPNTVDSIRSVSAANDLSLDTLGAKLDESDIHSYRKFPSRQGPPQAWFRENNILVLWPRPDANYSVVLDCRFRPWPLSLPDHYPALDDKWHEALYKGAKYRAWEGLQNDGKAMTTMNEMSRLIQRKTDRSVADRESQYPSMRPIKSARDMMELRRGIPTEDDTDGLH